MKQDDPKTLQSIRQVVLILARGGQPPEDMDVLPAVEFEYAEVKHWKEDGGFPGLVLTAKGMEAALTWLSAS
jgi:hypothetical protein